MSAPIKPESAPVAEVARQPISYRRLLHYLKPHRRRFCFALLAMCGYGATDGAIPLLIRRVLDDIFGSQDRSMLYVLPSLLVGFAVIRGSLGFLQQYLMASIGLEIIRDIRNDIHRKLLNLSQSFFDARGSGEIVSRVTNDSLLVRQALTDSVAAVLRDSVRVVALLCAAIYLDPMLGLISFVGFPLAILPVLKFGKKVRQFSRSGQHQLGGLTGVLHETLAGHGVVQSFGLEQKEQQRFEGENARLTTTLRRAEKYGALSAPTNEILASMAMGAVILYGGLSVINGIRTQGDFIAFMTSMFLLYDPLKKLGRSNTIFQMGLAAGERIFEVLDQPIEVADHPDAVPLARGKHIIEFQRVSFRYPGTGVNADGVVAGERAWALEDLTLRVAAGETLALVGMSGGGKSTIVKLLPRLYDPQHGAITINGGDIRGYTLESLRRSISVVSQQTFLFNDSIANNILFGALTASREEVIAAAKAANAHDFIMRLPEGYDTSVGEQGLRLSGGERARIAIARALLKDAPILILDEATAALDSESEALVQDAIDRLLASRTVIVIAHRLATIRKADRIAVMVRGKLVELGTHQELLNRNGEYAKLYRIQFAEHDANGDHAQNY